MAHRNEGHWGRNFIRAADVRGAEVVNLKGEKLGKITELVVDYRTGVTPYAVVSFGGVLGVNRDSIAVPMESFVTHGEEDRFVLETTRDQLESAPDFDPKNWDSLHDETWRDKIKKAFGRSPRIHQEAGSKEGKAGSFGVRYMLSKDLESAKIKDSHDESVGSIKDLVTDRHTCDNVGFVLVKTGVGGDAVPVPWTALHHVEGTLFRVPVDKSTFEDAPRLEKDEVHRLGETGFSDSVCTYFGVRPTVVETKPMGAGAGRPVTR